MALCSTQQDKWRNINVMVNGLGSRQRGRPACKSIQLPPKPDENTMALETVVENDSDVLNVKPLAAAAERLPNATSKKPISRLQHYVLV